MCCSFCCPGKEAAMGIIVSTAADQLLRHSNVDLNCVIDCVTSGLFMKAMWEQAIAQCHFS